MAESRARTRQTTSFLSPRLLFEWKAVGTEKENEGMNTVNEGMNTVMILVFGAVTEHNTDPL